MQDFSGEAAPRVRRTLVCAALVAASTTVGAAPAETSSVRGRVALSSGAAPPESCAVELTLSPYHSGGPGRGPGLEADASRPIVTAPVTADGSFRISSVPQGVHTLRVVCPSARALTFVSVGAEGETLVRAPIVLGDTTLAATLSPPLDPSGRAWRLTLSTADPALARVAAMSVARNGVWSLPGLTVGSYVLDVVDERGTTWLSRRVELTRTSRPLSLAIARTHIVGRVSFGRQPIAAALVFTDPTGARRMSLASGADGSFTGTFPVLPTGDWAVTVTARRPPLERRLEGILAQGRSDAARVWLELELDTRGATGCVAIEGGAAAAGALVTAEAVDDATRVQVLANADGCFDLGTPAPGAYRVWAELAGSSAEAQEIEIADGWPHTLQFTLRGSRQLSGRVVADGQPVAGANVQAWLSPGVPRSAVGADADGRFEQTVPNDEGELGVTVIAPGYAMKMTRVALGEEPLEIPLTTAGGELIVDLGKGMADERSVLIRRDGSVEWLDYLAQWGTVQSAASAERVALPQVEAGSYSACLVSRSEALWASAAAAEGCTSGTLDDGGRLVLVLNGTGPESPP